MPFGSGLFRSAPASASSFAASSCPSRAANSSGVMPPGAGGCSPCGGTPLRTMPTPCDPPPAPGGRAAGFGPTRVAASTEAPAASSSRMISVLFGARRPHQRRVRQRRVRRRSTRAPRSMSSRTASGLSARTAAISTRVAGGVRRVHVRARVEQPAEDRGVAVRWRRCRSASTPSAFVADTFAPARISASTVSRSSARTAQCSAVAPSGPVRVDVRGPASAGRAPPPCRRRRRRAPADRRRRPPRRRSSRETSRARIIRSTLRFSLRESRGRDQKIRQIPGGRAGADSRDRISLATSHRMRAIVGGLQPCRYSSAGPATGAIRLLTA